jgi:hypothetical protein
MLFFDGCVFLNLPSFGRLPRGKRQERIQRSPNYRDGKFQNRLPTNPPTLKGSISAAFRKIENRRPKNSIPTVKTDLKQLKRNEDIMLWFGHSSLLLQINGKRFLVDPVLVMASPVSFFNKLFEGTNVYTPDNIPDVDFLVYYARPLGSFGLSYRQTAEKQGG